MKKERRLIDGEWWEKVELPQQEEYIQTQSVEVENEDYKFKYTTMWDNNKNEWYKDGWLEITTNDFKNEQVDFWDNMEYLKNILNTFSVDDENKLFEENSEEIYTVLKIAKDKGWIL